MSTAAEHPTRVASRPTRPSDWMLDRLPDRLREDEFLERFVSIFQQLADSYVEQVDQLEHDFDPSVAPLAMVRLMGHWIGLDMIDSTVDEQTQRQLVDKMGLVSRWQGTHYGLSRLLELICDEPPEIVDSGGVYREGEAPLTSPHVVIRVSSSGWMSADHLVAVVRRELPASVTFELEIGGKQCWPRD